MSNVKFETRTIHLRIFPRGKKFDMKQLQNRVKRKEWFIIYSGKLNESCITR